MANEESIYKNIVKALANIEVVISFLKGLPDLRNEDIVTDKDFKAIVVQRNKLLEEAQTVLEQAKTSIKK